MIEGKRKYTITIAFLVTSIGLVIFKQIPATDWLQYTSYVILAYFGGNVGEHFTKTKK